MDNETAKVLLMIAIFTILEAALHMPKFGEYARWLRVHLASHRPVPNRLHARNGQDVARQPGTAAAGPLSQPPPA